ncbi:MAG: hypothetical protein IIZ93_15460 [Acidaminococcaceae bacterium]|nr:hypothetical protein [Acidaminococcaceae bacterium]
MAMTGFICQDEYLAKCAKLSDQEVGRLFRALMSYHATGIEPELAGRESIAFDFIKEDIDKTEKAYAAKCEKNRQNRLTTNVDERERTITKADERPQNKNIKEKENIKETTLKGSKEKPLARFTPPTVEEVAAYCKERGNRVNAQRFVDFYAAKGWKIGQNPMKDWKAAVRTWEQRDDSTTRPAKVVSAQQYTQRQYTEDELMAVSDDLLAEARANRGKTA